MSPDPTAWFAAAPRDGAAAPTEPRPGLAPPAEPGSAVNYVMVAAIVGSVLLWALLLLLVAALV